MRVYLQVWFQNSRARQKKHQQTTTTSVVSLSSHAARNNNNNNSSTSPSRPTTPSSLMTHHPAAAVAVLSAAAGYMNLNLRNSLVLHSAAPTAFVADQPTLTPDAQQHPEFVFSNSLFILSLYRPRRPTHGLHTICLEPVRNFESKKRPRKLKRYKNFVRI